MNLISRISENKGIEIPENLLKLCLKVLGEKIKLGKGSSPHYKKESKKWSVWLREQNIEGLQVWYEDDNYEVWNLLLIIRYDDI